MSSHLIGKCYSYLAYVGVNILTQPGPVGADSRRTIDTTGLAPPLRFGLSGRAPGPWGWHCLVALLKMLLISWIVDRYIDTKIDR